MFSLLKNIKWFNWVFIGIVIIGGLGLLFFYNQYTSQLVTTGSLTEKNSQLNSTIEKQDKSSAITDETVTQYTTKKIEELRELEQSRAGVIDEYINLSGQPETRQPSKEIVRVEEIGDKPIQKDSPTTSEASNPVTDNTALGVLSDRMHEHYCRAKRMEPQCGTR